MSQEYMLAIALIVVGIAQAFGIVIDQNQLVGFLTGASALWIAIRRYRKGDITLGGFHKASTAAFSRD